MSVWDDVAARYDGIYSRPVDFAEDLVLRDSLPPLAGRSVIDLGCGTGWLLDYLSPVIHPRNYIGVDSSANMIGAARRKWPLYTFCQLDMQRLSLFPSSSFDVVLSFYSPICYCEHPWAAAAEAWRVLKPGGRLVFMAYTARGRRRKIPGMDEAGRETGAPFTPTGLRCLFPKLRDVQVRGLNALGDAVYRGFGNVWGAWWLMRLDFRTAGRLAPGAAYTMILSGRKG